MMYYLETGISTTEYPQQSEFFFVEELNTTVHDSKYVYSNDTIIRSVLNECRSLYSAIETALFIDMDEYYALKSMLPIGFMELGMSPEAEGDKNWFSEFLNNHSFPQKFKFVYLFDIENLIDTLQELLLNTEINFVYFYKNISSIAISMEDGVYIIRNSHGRVVYQMLNAFFISLYSCFDIITKIAYEVEKRVNDFTVYQPLKSKDILFGDRKRLKIIGKAQTIFEPSPSVRKVESFRNEIIHNAVIDSTSSVYVRIENGIICERFIRMPDFEDNHFSTYKNRKRFYSTDMTINHELPSIYFSVLEDIKRTVANINLYLSKCC